MCTCEDPDCLPRLFCSSSHAGGVSRDLGPICQIQSNFHPCFVSNFVLRGFVPSTAVFAPVAASAFAEARVWEVVKNL